MSDVKAPELKYIPLSQIRTNPAALRGVNKETEKYQGLVDSIKSHGVLNAILVRELPSENGTPLYGLSDGLHRFTASQDAGKEVIPAQVTSLDNAEMLEAQIIANIHKIETTPVEYTKGLQRMIASNPTMTAPELCGRLSKSVTWLNDRLSLTKLKENIQTLVDEGQIKLTNAFALASLDQSLQEDFLERAMTLSPQEFVPTAQKAKKEFEAAKRAGRDPKANEFTSTAFLQKVSVIKSEIENPTVGPRLISSMGVTSPIAAFKLALDWVMNQDPESVEAQKKKFDERKKAAEDKKAAAKAEREKKAAEIAAKAILGGVALGDPSVAATATV